VSHPASRAPAPAAPRPWLLLAAALVTVAAAHSPAIPGPPIWDDHLLLSGPGEPPGLDVVGHLRRPYLPNLGGGVAYYRPLTTLSYAVDRAWGGGRTAAFHATNLLIHLGVVLLVFALARRHGADAVTAAAVAMAFGVLPRLTESVDWIAGRTDPLAGLLVLAALLLHRSEPDAWGRRCAAAVSLLLGLLSKEVALAGIPALAAGEWARAKAGGGARRALANLLPAAAALVAYLALRASALGVAPPVMPAVAPGAGGRLRLMVQTLGQYLLMLLDPLRPRLRVGRIDQVELLPLALGVIGMALLAWAAARMARAPDPFAARALALSVAALAPVLHAVPLVLTAVAADRFLYLPAAGLALLAAAPLDRLARARPRPFAGAAVAAVALLALGTYARALDWADELQLWERAVATAAPGDPVPLHEAAMVHVRADRPALALPFLRRTTPLVPPAMRPDALSDEAAVLSDLGRYPEARQRIREALALGGQPELLYNWAIVELRGTDYPSAREALARLLATSPRHPGGLAALRLLEVAQRRFGDLPPESPGEPTATRARRARFLELVGLRSPALACWRDVARSSLVPADLLDAAGQLTAGRDLSAAGEALQRARQHGADLEAVERIGWAIEAARKAP